MPIGNIYFFFHIYFPDTYCWVQKSPTASQPTVWDGASKPPGSSNWFSRKGETTGVEVTTGPLAQGVATSVGLEPQKSWKISRVFLGVFFSRKKTTGQGCLIDV